MLQVEHQQETQRGAEEGPEAEFSQGSELHLYTRYEHGNLPVRVHRTEAGTVYEVTTPSEACSSGRVVETFRSARALMRSIYGHDVHMPFDRYFRLGRYGQQTKGSGQACLLTLLEDEPASPTRRTGVVVHSPVKVSLDHPKTTTITLSRGARTLPLKARKEGLPRRGVEKAPLDMEVQGFFEAMEGDLLPREAFVVPTEEMKAAFRKSFVLELDRVEGVVGIDLGAESERRGAVFRADEVRKLLWRGFAGKMLSQGYDPEDVLQEVYRGLLVRNNGKCPWDGRKSTFGHYVHMVISCVLTNYHRKQARRIDKDSVPLDVRRDGESMGDVGQWGSCTMEEGGELGDRSAIQGLAGWLAQLEDDDAEAVLGREILPLVAAGHQRGEIVERTGRKASLVSRALAWLRRQSAAWALSGGLDGAVPTKYRTA